MSEQRPIDRLLEVMRRLRDPEHGCPWDIEQDFASIAPYTIEEAYEVADAIARGDFGDLESELGDLLLQVVYHGRMGEEAGLFDFDSIAAAITAKMIARHPHVFGDSEVESAAAQSEAWEATKARERAARASASGRPPGVLDDIPLGLPGLTRAMKLQKRAARTGFDWPDLKPVRAKIDEELAELDAAEGDAVADELGDVLFTLVNYARKAGIDPEEALRRTNMKFESRFRALERKAAERGIDLHEAGLERLDALWDEAKRDERDKAG